MSSLENPVDDYMFLPTRGAVCQACTKRNPQYIVKRMPLTYFKMTGVRAGMQTFLVKSGRSRLL